ncbi:MAG TPA: hypothetical protein VN832_00520 [Stellaceae bacterium]|nr:hypothetical protein [Stellaceae bacterium]
MNSGDFYAQGSARFVAGAAIGNAIGTSFAQAATYDDCMMAIGYTPEAPQSSAVAPVVAAAPQSGEVTPVVQAAQIPSESVVTVLPPRPYQREIIVLPPRCIEPGTSMFALPDHLQECIAAGGELVR